MFSFFSLYGALRELRSFPTRRSSDLGIADGESTAPVVPRTVAPWPSTATSSTSWSRPLPPDRHQRSEEHTSNSTRNLVCRLLLEKKKTIRHREPRTRTHLHARIGQVY